MKSTSGKKIIQKADIHWAKKNLDHTVAKGDPGAKSDGKLGASLKIQEGSPKPFNPGLPHLIKRPHPITGKDQVRLHLPNLQTIYKGNSICLFKSIALVLVSRDKTKRSHLPECKPWVLTPVHGLWVLEKELRHSDSHTVDSFILILRCVAAISLFFHCSTLPGKWLASQYGQSLLYMLSSWGMVTKAIQESQSLVSFSLAFCPLQGHLLSKWLRVLRDIKGNWRIVTNATTGSREHSQITHESGKVCSLRYQCLKIN